jgi:hypothetical protein
MSGPNRTAYWAVNKSLHQDFLDKVVAELKSRQNAFALEVVERPKELLEGLANREYQVCILSSPHDYSSIPPSDYRGGSIYGLKSLIRIIRTSEKNKNTPILVVSSDEAKEFDLLSGTINSGYGPSGLFHTAEFPNQRGGLYFVKRVEEYFTSRSSRRRK